MKRSTTGLASAAVLAVAFAVPMATSAMGTPSAVPQVAAPSGAPGLAADESASVKDVRTTSDGTRITRYERTYKGLKVIGGRYATRQASGQSLAGAQVVAKTPITLQSTTPTLTAEQAAAKVDTAKYLKGAKQTRTTKELRVFLDNDGSSKLVYDVYIEGSGKGVADVKTHVYVDARTGATIATDSEVYTGSGDGVYDKNVTFGSQYTSSGYTPIDSHGNLTTDLKSKTYGATKVYDSDDVWGGSNWTQAQVVDAQKGVEGTYNFFYDTYGRKGIWDTGKGAEAQIRLQSCFANAQWTGSVIQLGEGDNCQKPLTQFDVMAHEMTHGVTQSTANFTYSRESGGLNEAMSDIFAVLAEFHADMDGDTPDYLMGELIDLRGDGKPLRYMDKPSKDGVSFDCWESSFTSSSSEVHYTSGPMNHAFYLMAEGSGAKTINGVAYNSPTCNGSTVTGIGRDKAGKIIYTALTSDTVTQGSTYAQWRGELIKAAKSLYGSGSAECIATDKAMAAVGTPATSVSCGTPTGTPTTPTTSTSTSTTAPTGTTPLTNGVPVTASGAAGSETFYSITVPSGASNLVISTSGGSGDVDLYTKLGAKPTDTSYDCRPYKTGNAESCTVASPAAGTYYVRLKGYSSYSGVTLEASWS